MRSTSAYERIAMINKESLCQMVDNEVKVFEPNRCENDDTCYMN